MYMLCSICNERVHDDEYEYSGGKEAYFEVDRVCDYCIEKGLDLLKKSIHEENGNRTTQKDAMLEKVSTLWFCKKCGEYTIQKTLNTPPIVCHNCPLAVGADTGKYNKNS